jgi:hypothetical protein
MRARSPAICVAFVGLALSFGVALRFASVFDTDGVAVVALSSVM